MNSNPIVRDQTDLDGGNLNKGKDAAITAKKASHTSRKTLLHPIQNVIHNQPTRTQDPNIKDENKLKIPEPGTSLLKDACVEQKGLSTNELKGFKESRHKLSSSELENEVGTKDNLINNLEEAEACNCMCGNHEHSLEYAWMEKAVISWEEYQEKVRLGQEIEEEERRKQIEKDIEEVTNQEITLPDLLQDEEFGKSLCENSSLFLEEYDEFFDPELPLSYIEELSLKLQNSLLENDSDIISTAGENDGNVGVSEFLFEFPEIEEIPELLLSRSEMGQDFARCAST